MPLITNQLAHHHFRHSFRPVFPVPPVENLTDRTGGLAAFVVIPARPPYRTVAGDARIATPGASVRVRMLSHHRGGKRRGLWRSRQIEMEKKRPQPRPALHPSVPLCLLKKKKRH